MISATAMVAGVAAIALTGGLLLNGLVPAPPPEERLPAAASETASEEATVAATEPTEQVAEPTATVEAEPQAPTSDERLLAITLPDPLTEGVVGGTIETPAGPARWAKITSKDFEVPVLDTRLGTLVPWDDGVALWDANSVRNDGRVGLLWITTDGLTWQPERFPGDLHTRAGSDGPNDHDMLLDSVSGSHFLVQPRTGRIWRRTSDGAWTPLDTSAIAKAPRGWGSRFRWFEGWRLVEGEPVIDVSFRYRLPRNRLGILQNQSTNRMHRVGENRYALCPADNAKCSAKEAAVVVRFKATEDGLVVRDDRTGERYGLLKGAKASELYDGDSGVRRQTLALDGDRLVPVDAPRAGAKADQEPVPPGLPDGNPWRLDSGWVAAAGGDPGRWWLHVADEWVDLAELGFPELQPYGPGWGAAGVGNATLLSYDHRNGTTDLWVITAPDGG